MKKSVFAAAAMLGAFALVATGCAGGAAPGAGGNGGGGGDDVIKVGFAQTGSESGWRAANTESMKKAFSAENGFELIFNAADNKQEAQISAVRNFINQGVDAIVIAPITVDGWDDVLKEAKDAVDNVPSTIKEGVTKAEAEEIKKKLEEQGAVVELK